MDDIKVGRRFFLKSGGTAAAAMGAAVIPIHNANAAPAAAAGTLKSIEHIAREHAARRPRPVRGVLAAGAQVRSDRDGR
jgi:SLT domain-containing protein